MVFGIGTDIVEVDRIREAIEKYGDKFRKKIYTETEIEYCESFKVKKYVHYAARFAIKESFSKAIGTGLTQGFKFTEIGVKNETSGKPIIELSGSMAEKWGSYLIHASISHSEINAISYVLIEMNNNDIL